MSRSDGVTGTTTIDGFAAATLGNDQVELVVVPRLGARIVALRHRPSDRDWIWQPAPRVPLRAALPGSDFEQSGHSGIDECLPTIGACEVDGRRLPDHGEAWTAAWQWEPEAAAIRTAVALPISGLQLTRELTLQGSSVQCAYTLTNPTDEPVPFVWAFHPLFGIRPGDRLVPPAGASELLLEVAQGRQTGGKGERWAFPSPFPGYNVERLDLGGHPGACLKGFLGPLPGPRTEISLVGEGAESLRLSWDSRENPWCGLWLARGYKKWHHVALEPTNAPADRLDQVATPRNPAPRLEPRECRRWSLSLTLA
jgi:galactose mutarotase-like enzyme